MPASAMATLTSVNKRAISGTVRIFQDGKVALHIEPLARPMIWQHFRIDDDSEMTPSTPAVVHKDRVTD